MGDNQATQSRLLDKYLITAGETVAAIRVSASTGAWVAASELAHKLKSSSRSVGAIRLGALCEALEREGRAGAITPCTTLVPLVLQGFDTVQAQIRAGR